MTTSMGPDGGWLAGGAETPAVDRLEWSGVAAINFLLLQQEEACHVYVSCCMCQNSPEPFYLYLHGTSWAQMEEETGR